MSLPEYLSNEEERTTQPMKLFRNVNNLITGFVDDDNSNLPKDKVRRFICDNLFVDIVNELHGKIELLKDIPATG
ncbi:hypothetical protein MAM1_0904d11350 [Mucor ambiguus]|uniref:Uncharacterized protein n=1 Tax=Mucor ambiguus TaxID=91626 RepID=A0A0C9NAH7_9FUNG|nr:hypothetical protein MAM1_0904d11350 [Mucor ambiguus]